MALSRKASNFIFVLSTLLILANVPSALSACSESSTCSSSSFSSQCDCEGPSICDNDVCKEVECARDGDCSDGKVCATAFSQSPNTCVDCNYDWDCDGEEKVCSEAGVCKDPDSIQVKCLETQISVDGGVCEGTHTLRMCAESQEQADQNGEYVASELATKTDAVCAEDDEEMCQRVGGTAKSAECPSCEAVLNSVASSWQCTGDNTCEYSTSARARQCCQSESEMKNGVKAHCDDVDGDRLDSMATVAMAFMSANCYDEDCVKISSSGRTLNMFAPLFACAAATLAAAVALLE
mmetsp:Transcript_63147/g.131308  ORF Transcript_63147/g.131308 Transcript_63147/m.131308 type:complete len:294 (+) Transcript_63147:139-1020(+)